MLEVLSMRTNLLVALCTYVCLVALKQIIGIIMEERDASKLIVGDLRKPECS